MGPGDLSRVLAPLAVEDDPRILVGRESFDDAGVFLVADGLALVQTVDFFAPVVDDPYAFGRIAAANALSDVYAMGGEPLTALAIVGFPIDALPHEVLTTILRGGQDALREAGCRLVGGHSVVDEEVKFGLSVTGRVAPDRILTNAGARPGDRLVLTKPIGTGILTTAARAGRADAAHLDAAIGVMSALNRDAAAAAVHLAARCATDVTGFGLLGHASHVARASGVTVRIRAADVPTMDGARELAASGVAPGGTRRNLDYLEPLTAWGGADDVVRRLLADPQTSGGLLVALPADRVQDYLGRVPGAREVGEIEPRGAHAIVVD